MAVNCAFHPERRATGKCIGCKRPLCAECGQAVGAARYCPDCIAEVGKAALAQEKQRLLAALSYSPLFVVPLVAMLSGLKREAYLRYHATQACVFWLGTLLLLVVLGLADWLLFHVPSLGIIFAQVFHVLFWLFAAGWAVLIAIYIHQAYRGDRFEIPYASLLMKKLRLHQP